MKSSEWLVTQFHESRAHLLAVAYRMLGSATEAEDAVQEAWLKLTRADTSGVENLRGWLTTVVGRVCLDMLRTRRSRREDPLAPATDSPSEGDPETDLALENAVGSALLVVLDTLKPGERIAFILHDMFDVPFEEIAPIVQRTHAAARQLASRARRVFRGPTSAATEVARKRELIDAFLAASRDGDFERLISVLSPDVVMRADDLAVSLADANARQGAPRLAPEVCGASSVANSFKGRARAALPALINGEPGAVWTVSSQIRAAFVFTIRYNKIIEIDIVMDQRLLAKLEVENGDGGINE